MNAPARSIEAALALKLFAFLDEMHVPYVVVGDVRDYQTAVASDIDIVVSDDAFSGMARLISLFAARHEGRLLQAIRHEACATRFDIAFGDAKRRHYLHPDVSADFYWSGRAYVRASDLLRGRSRAAAGFWVPAPANAFAYYLAKKVNKRALDDRAFAYLRELYATDGDGCHQWAVRRLTKASADILVDVLQRDEPEEARMLLSTLRHDLHRTSPISMLDRWSELRRAAMRVLQPTGLWLAFYGPDGVGKSTVIDLIEERLSPSFLRTHRYHLRPHVYRRTASRGASVADPHAKPPRGRLSSAGKVAYWWWDAVYGYFVSVRWQIVRSALVVFDRYVDDLSVDPRRYRYGGPKWAVELLRRSTPRPHLSVVMDAPAAVLQARKPEVSPEESDRQRSAYRALAERTPSSVVVDATAPVEDVVRDVEGAVFNLLEARTRRRLGLA